MIRVLVPLIRTGFNIRVNIETRKALLESKEICCLKRFLNYVREVLINFISSKYAPTAPESMDRSVPAVTTSPCHFPVFPDTLLSRSLLFLVYFVVLKGWSRVRT
jgi:hypothetical protein